MADFVPTGFRPWWYSPHARFKLSSKTTIRRDCVVVFMCLYCVLVNLSVLISPHLNLLYSVLGHSSHMLMSRPPLHSADSPIIVDTIVLTLQGRLVVLILLI
jgi:hypothetical protein